MCVRRAGVQQQCSFHVLLGKTLGETPLTEERLLPWGGNDRLRREESILRGPGKKFVFSPERR